MSDLLPCPFCGAPAHGYEIEAHQHSPALLALCPDLPAETSGSYVIEGQCECGCGMIGDSQEAVTTRWNRRTQPAQVPTLTDEELDAAEIEGGNSYRRWTMSGPRGQMLMPQDSFQWHVSRAIEAALLAKMKGGGV